MLIQCTSCGATAKIPDSKEGAKVRCPSCGHVYVARPKSAAGRSSRKEDPTKYFIIGGALLAAIVIAMIATSGGDEPSYATPKPEPKKKDEGPYVDPMGWEGPVVRIARDMHNAAFAGNDSKVRSKMDGEGAYAIEGEKIAALAAEAAAALEIGDAAENAEGAPAETTDRAAWSTLDEIEKVQFTDARVAAALTMGAEGAVHGWKPYDGSVVSMEAGMAVVHLQVQARDASAGLDDRWTRWTLKNLDGEGGPDDRWRWVDVDRYITPEELAKMNRKTRKKAEKKTLSDGSVVYESEIRAIAFPADVPADEQARLSKLADDLVADLDAPPRVRNKIATELVDTGKNAIPAVLTTMARISGELSDDMSQNEDALNRIFFLHNVMRDITGIETTFDVSVEMGATKERINSGIKQWYGWYDRKFKRFEGLEAAGDPLADDPDFQPKTPEEIRRYNKALKEQLEEERRRKNGGG